MNRFTVGYFSPRILPLIAISLVLFSCGSKDQQQAAPPEIKVVEIQQKDVPLFYDFVGQIYGEVDIPIRARVSGWVESIHFQEGSRVKKGQLLYTIDKQPFMAQLSQQQSKLAEAKTAFVKAEADLNRYKPLAKKNAVSQSDLDAAQASYDAAEAYVDAAEASVELARIELSYCEIRSPIDGLIGKTNAKAGEFVGQSPNPVILNTVSSTGKVRVEFFLTESDYLILARERSKRIAEDKEPIENEEKANLQLILSDGSIHPIMGSVDFINREVDQETGSLLIQASFDNPDGLLRPGQFARVRVKMKTVDNALILPQKCFSELQGLFSVTTVNNENKIEIKQVEVGPIYKDYRLIKSGLEVGDRAVIEGIQKVRPGMVVDPLLIQYESQYNEEINK